MTQPRFLTVLGTALATLVFIASCGSQPNNPGTADLAVSHSPDLGSSPTLDCASYCNTIMANCASANAQYASAMSCMNVCAGFTAKGMLGDTSGDTLGCRLYHAGAAGGSAGNAMIHCPHAGPTGGDKDPKGSAGVCGEPCTAFCSVAAAVCTGTNQQFADMPTCVAACQGFHADAAAYSTADTSTNDLGCRFYHLSAAAASAAAAQTHCPHIVANSPVCTM